MNFLIKICIAFISIAAVIFASLYAVHLYREYIDQHDLEIYYSKQLEQLYTNGYAVDQNGQLLWSQSKFETAQEKLRNQMLAEGFNHARIERMEEEGRAKGQETRRFWDKLRGNTRITKTVKKDQN